VEGAAAGAGSVFFALPGLGPPYPVLHQWNREPFVPQKWVPKETTFLFVEAAWLGGRIITLVSQAAMSLIK